MDVTNQLKDEYPCSKCCFSKRLSCNSNCQKLTEWLERLSDVGTSKKTSKKSLCWNVYVEDINSKSIVPLNIFNLGGFLKLVELDFKKYSTDRVAFGEQLKHDLQYYLWSRAEYEIILYDLHETGIKLKVSAYDQVLLNWDVFVSYVFDSLS